MTSGKSIVVAMLIVACATGVLNAQARRGPDRVGFGARCFERHSSAPTYPWRLVGRSGGAWIAECYSAGECSRLEREHACQAHGICGGSASATSPVSAGTALTPLAPPRSVGEGIGRGIVVLGGMGLLVSTLFPDDIHGKKPILPVTAGGAFAGLTLGTALNARHMSHRVAALLIGAGITGMLVEKAQYDKGR